MARLHVVCLASTDAPDATFESAKKGERVPRALPAQTTSQDVASDTFRSPLSHTSRHSFLSPNTHSQYRSGQWWKAMMRHGDFRVGNGQKVLGTCRLYRENTGPEGGWKHRSWRRGVSSVRFAVCSDCHLCLSDSRRE